MGWTDYLANQSFNIRAQIPSRVAEPSFWERLKGSLPSDLGGLALKMFNPFPARKVSDLPYRVAGGLTAAGAVGGGLAALAGGKAAVKAVPSLYAKMKGGLGEKVGKGAVRQARREGKAYIKKRRKRQRRASRTGSGRKARRSRPQTERAFAVAEAPPRRVRKPPTPKQLAAQRKFAARVKSGEFKRG